VSVYYKGCLKKTMKEFDSCLKGKPFTFRVGQGEVIKVWDNGVEGMQIGGKRRLIVPPTLGYGSKPMGSSIPPNSTLIFVIELLKVH
ncbi:peptidylprolyl isomerase, partial [Paramuricea clavata]